ncbi:HR-like lesion-inducer [Dillenia turbinata]|uniref:HR-like lesion-inducer n=1 Tax=Dillenia turbinata TaxID=194707 RepID=A0AAN8V919_9MAGN
MSGTFNEFGIDGGPAAKALRPKVYVFSRHISAHVAVKIPEFEIKYLVATAIALKGLGGLIFIFGSSLGALLLLLHQLFVTPIMYDFYNYDADRKEFAQLFVKFTQNLALVGALLFFIGMKNVMPRRQVKKKAPKTKTV